MAAAASRDADSDCLSSSRRSSAFTAAGSSSRRSCVDSTTTTTTDVLSLSSVSSVSSSSASAAYATPHKPHKASQAEWQSIRRARAAATAGALGLDHFRLLRRLGTGDLGSVYLCQLRPCAAAAAGACLYAMKVVDREAAAARKKLRRAEAEREILRGLDHPFLPTLYAEFDAAHYSCLVMEFCPGGDLHVARQRQPFRRFSVSAARFYVAETLLALEYLHMMGVVYRDLKPENVLIRSDGHIMLSDFDLSLKCHVTPKLLKQKRVPRSASTTTTTTTTTTTAASAAAAPSCVSSPMQPVLSCFYNGVSKCSAQKALRMPPRAGECDVDDDDDDDDDGVVEAELVAEPVAARSKSFVGTHEYLAPEVISGAGHGSAVDWWTLGVFLYEMIYGRTPFKGENNEKTLINILKQPLRFPKINTTSAKDLEDVSRAQDLISRLLVKNPKRRIGSVKGSVEIKKHDFFKGVNWALIRSVKPPEVPRSDNMITRRGIRSKAPVPVQKLMTKKERDEPYHIPDQYIDYF